MMSRRRHLAQLGLGHSGERPRFDEDGESPHAYPRPLLRRTEWLNLNGTWEYALDADAQHHEPTSVRFDARIEVPFAPETTASEIGRASCRERV